MSLINHESSAFWKVWEWKLDPYRCWRIEKRVDALISLQNQGKISLPLQLISEKTAGFFCHKVFPQRMKVLCGSILVRKMVKLCCNIEYQILGIKLIYFVIRVRRRAVFTVTGMSVWPLICHGRDQVIVERVQSEDLELGDIVLYRISEEHYILHRVTGLRDKTFQITGDGNFFRDPFVPYNCLIAKVSTVIRDGKVIPCNSWKWKRIFLLWMALFQI